MKRKGTALGVAAVAVLAFALALTSNHSAGTGPQSPATSASATPTPRGIVASAWPAPDQRLTPGAIVPGCTYPRPDYERLVTASTKRIVAAMYHRTIQPGDEFDHRVPDSLCGFDDWACPAAKSCEKALANIWIEPYDGVKRSAFTLNYKDILERKIAHLVSLGPPRGMTLAQGQAVFLGDWRTGYCHYVDPSPCVSR